MSITPVPISIRLVRAPTAASSGKGEASCRAKWCTRKYAPSAPSSSAATASSIDCRSASDADRVLECGEGVQWPKDRKPIFFTPVLNHQQARIFPVRPVPGSRGCGTPATMSCMSWPLLALDLVGVFTFGLTGGLAAVQKQFDVLGVVVLAVAAGLG